MTIKKALFLLLCKKNRKNIFTMQIESDCAPPKALPED